MIITLCGVNQHEVAKRLREIKKDFTKLNGTAGVESYSAEQLTVNNLAAILTGTTLFATYRLVIIYRVSENKEVTETLLPLLARIPQEVSVVLVEGQLDKRTVFYKTLKKETDFFEFKELAEGDLLHWIKQVVDEAGGRITPVNARLLQQYVGTDQTRLQNELNKLLAYDPNITEQSIAELVEQSSQETVFQLLDRTLNGDASQALAVLKKLEDAHEDPFAITNLLIWQTNIVAIVFSAKNETDGAVAKAAKVNPFVVKKTRGLTRRMNATSLNRIIDLVAELDITLKTTAVDPWELLGNTIVEIASSSV